MAHAIFFECSEQSGFLVPNDYYTTFVKHEIFKNKKQVQYIIPIESKNLKLCNKYW